MKMPLWESVGMRQKKGQYLIFLQIFPHSNYMLLPLFFCTSIFFTLQAQSLFKQAAIRLSLLWYTKPGNPRGFSPASALGNIGHLILESFQNQSFPYRKKRYSNTADRQNLLSLYFGHWGPKPITWETVNRKWISKLPLKLLVLWVLGAVPQRSCSFKWEDDTEK